MNKQYENIVYI